MPPSIKELEIRLRKRGTEDEEKIKYRLNKSAEELMGEEVLLQIAREIAEKLRKNITVDWSVRESVRARLRLLVKSLLRKYKYPPDQQDEAVELVLSQAEVISEEWAVN